MKKLIEDSKNLMGKYDSRTREEFIKMLDDSLNQLTEEQRATATFCLETYSEPYDPTDYCALFLKFKRLETDKEEKARLAQEAQYAKDRESREAAEYARLKKKFEKKA